MITSDTTTPTCSRTLAVSAATSLIVAATPSDAIAQMYRQRLEAEPSAVTQPYLLPSAQPYLLSSDTSIPLSSPEVRIRVTNEAARTELAALRDLREGWDGRRAPAPTEFALATAERIIAAADVVRIGLARVAADVEGGVVLYAFANDAARTRVGFVIANDDEESLVVFKTKRGAPEPDMEMVALRDISRALADALRFLS